MLVLVVVGGGGGGGSVASGGGGDDDGSVTYMGILLVDYTYIPVHTISRAISVNLSFS